MTKVEELRQLARVIKNETAIGGNTAERVGSAFEGVADAIEGIDQINEMEKAVDAVKEKLNASKQAIEEAVSSLPIAQETGDSATKVMSQAAVTKIISQYDVSASTGGVAYTLQGAINAVPTQMRRGGMSIKYIDSETSEYTEYICFSSTWTSDVASWRKVGANAATAQGKNLQDIANTLYGGDTTLQYNGNWIDRVISSSNTLVYNQGSQYFASQPIKVPAGFLIKVNSNGNRSYNGIGITSEETVQNGSSVTPVGILDAEKKYWTYTTTEDSRIVIVCDKNNKDFSIVKHNKKIGAEDIRIDGDAINNKDVTNVEEAITRVFDKVGGEVVLSPKWTKKSYINYTNGRLMNASYTDATDFINVEDVDKVVITTPNSVTSSVLGLAFYSEKDESAYLIGFGATTTSTANTYYKVEKKVPDGAKYMRTCRFSDIVSNGDAKIYLYKKGLSTDVIKAKEELNLNRILSQVNYLDLAEGEVMFSELVIGRKTTIKIQKATRKGHNTRHYKQEVKRGDQFIVKKSINYQFAPFYAIVNGDRVVESLPRMGLEIPIVNYDTDNPIKDYIITCGVSGTLYINIDEGGYVVKVDHKYNIIDREKVDIDTELCQNSVLLSSLDYDVNFWVSGKVDKKGNLYAMYSQGIGGEAFGVDPTLTGSYGYQVISKSNIAKMNNNDIKRVSSIEVRNGSAIKDITVGRFRGYWVKEVDNEVIRVMATKSAYSPQNNAGIYTWDRTLDTVAKNTITYQGTTVDYSQFNLSKLLIDKGIITGTPNGSDSDFDFTRQVFSDGYYWTFERGLQSNNIRPCLMRSQDCIAWEIVKIFPDITSNWAETAISVFNGVLYAVTRNHDVGQAMSYFVYDITNDVVLKEMTYIPNCTRSRPSAFMYQDNVYFVVNELCDIYHFHEDRLQVAIFRVMPDCSLQRVYTLASPDGIMYHDICVCGSYEKDKKVGEYPRYINNQAVYMLYTCDKRKMQPLRVISDVVCLNITSCLETKNAGQQRRVDWAQYKL